jgi:adenylate cyclase
VNVFAKFPHRFVEVARTLVFRLVLMLTIGLAGALLNVTGPIMRVEESMGLGTLFRLRDLLQPPSPPKDVAIIEIDHDSYAALTGGQGRLADALGGTRPPMVAEPARVARQQWPRRFDAELIRWLKRAGVLLTVFDKAFEGAETTSEDEELAGAMRDAGNVIIAQQFEFEAKDVNDSIQEQCHRKKSLPIIEEAAIASAPIPVPELESRDTAVDFAAYDPTCELTLPGMVYQIHALRRAGDSLARMAGRDPSDLAGLRQDAVNAFFEELRERMVLDHDEVVTYEDTDRARMVATLLQIRDPDARFLINHYGPSGAIQTCLIQEILSPSRLLVPEHCSAAALRDKVVFVGFAKNYEPERNREQFKSPFGKVSMVELIATTFANILQNDAIRPLPSQASSWLLLIWGGAIGFCYGRWYFPRAFAIVAALSLGYLVLAYGTFVSGRWWLPLTVPMGIQSAATSLVALIAFLIPRSPRKLQALILASDMQDTVRMAETLSAEQLLAYRRGYFKLVKERLERHGGIFANQVADDFYGYWPLHARGSAEVDRACHAALAITGAVGAYIANENIRTPLRIGLHSGEEEVIPSLTIERKEYRFIGKSSGIASRIENMNKVLRPDPPILLSASALPKSPEFVVRRLGRFLPQGLEDPLDIYQLVGWAAHCSAELKTLLEGFSDALGLMEDLRYVDALTAFKQLGGAYPSDGPTQFYIRYLEPRVGHPAFQNERRYVRIDKERA